MDFTAQEQALLKHKRLQQKRDSARRSRQRKDAEITDLRQEVERLQTENSALLT